MTVLLCESRALHNDHYPLSLSLITPGGTYWGEGGWFKLIRGVDNLGVESNCDWAVPAAINL